MKSREQIIIDRMIANSVKINLKSGFFYASVDKAAIRIFEDTPRLAGHIQEWQKKAKIKAISINKIVGVFTPENHPDESQELIAFCRKCPIYNQFIIAEQSEGGDIQETSLYQLFSAIDQISFVKRPEKVEFILY